MNSQHTKLPYYNLPEYTRLLIKTGQFKEGDIVYCDYEGEKKSLTSGYIGEAIVVGVGELKNGIFFCTVKPLRKYFIDKISAYFHPNDLNHKYYMMLLERSNGN